jgi:hypothetical protein
MKKDNYKTDVMFRKNKATKEIEAFFPYEIQDPKGNILCYAHLGQHSSACYDYLLFQTKPVKDNEFSNLFHELISLGYNLKIVKRRNYNRFIKALNEIRK